MCEEKNRDGQNVRERKAERERERDKGNKRFGITLVTIQYYFSYN